VDNHHLQRDVSDVFDFVAMIRFPPFDLGLVSATMALCGVSPSAPLHACCSIDSSDGPRVRQCRGRSSDRTRADHDHVLSTADCR